MNSASAVAAPVELAASVGHNAANNAADVRAVQILLNKAGAGLKEDANCGKATIAAIEAYQRNFSHHPDGRIDPGGVAWKHLMQGKLKIKNETYNILPQVCGNGYYTYSPMNRQYGTTATIAALVRIAQSFSRQYPELQIAIGDMSLAHGGEMHPHKSHRNGRNADIRPLRTDGKMLPVTIYDSQYSRDRTKALVQIIRADSNFQSVLFNDSAIPGVTHWEGHDNHLHVTMKA